MKKLGVLLKLIKEESGVAMVLAVSAVAILFILIMAFIPMMVNEMSLTTVQRKSGQAFYVAEAGLDQAVWTLQQGNNWETYYNSATPKTETGVLGEGRYTIAYEASTSSANQIKLTSEGYFPADGGFKRTVEAIAVNTRFSAFNHAMQSGSAIANAAAGTIEYGDVYAKDTINFQGTVSSTPNFYSCSITGFTRNGGSFSPWGTNLHLITAAEFPDLTESDLDFLKDFARKTNTYYSGADSTHTFTRDELEAIDTANPEGAIIFVDTPNGEASSETNKASVEVQTNSYFYGVFVVRGDLHIAGNGSGTVVGQDENGNPVTLTSITFNGYIYASGAYSWSGTPGIYGSLIAGSIAGSGTPNVYYNIDFKNRPMLPTVLGAIELISWHEKK